MPENGEFKGKIKAELAFNDKEHERLGMMITDTESRLLHAIDLFCTNFEEFRQKDYEKFKVTTHRWFGGLSVAVAVGTFLAILLITHLIK